MKTLLAAALLLGASSVVARAEWEILDGWPTASAPQVVDGSSNAPEMMRVTRPLGCAGQTDVRLQRLPQLWTGTAIKDGSEVMLQIDTQGHIIDRKQALRERRGRLRRKFLAARESYGSARIFAAGWIAPWPRITRRGLTARLPLLWTSRTLQCAHPECAKGRTLPFDAWLSNVRYRFSSPVSRYSAIGQSLPFCAHRGPSVPAEQIATLDAVSKPPLSFPAGYAQISQMFDFPGTRVDGVQMSLSLMLPVSTARY